MSQIPCKQSKRIEMTGWFKHVYSLSFVTCVQFVVNVIEALRNYINERKQNCVFFTKATLSLIQKLIFV